MQNTWDVIVVGGGVAGLSSALMLGRARRRVLVIDAGSPRNRFADAMHGVLGHEGAAPADLVVVGRTEVERYGVVVRDGVVERVESDGDGLRVALAAGERLSARALVVATGVSDALPEIPGLAERWGKTVFHCPYCHGWEVRDKRIGVLTTSPMGMHQATLIRQWSDRVTVFTAGAGEVSPELARRLSSRGVRVEPAAVVEIRGEGDDVTAVRLEDGGEVEVDAILTAGSLVPHDGFLAPLGLARTENPVGSFIAVDPAGKTSDDRVWAAGNVVNPMGNVPMSMGAGAMAGGAVNGALVERDFDAAETDRNRWPMITSVEWWEERYASTDRIWSRRANAALVDVASGLEPGRALDVGSGEGGDVVWLATEGWDATGVDVSATATSRAAEAARDAGAERARFVTGGVDDLDGAEFDLVTASFLHSPAGLPREAVLRRASERVAVGGHLLVISHAGVPPWADAEHLAHHRFSSPQELLEQLDLADERWETVIAEVREREVTDPDGEPATIGDGVLLLRRR